jgi:hypothetical protein
MAKVVVLPVRGGNRGNGSNAGLAYPNLNNRRSNSNNNIGLRPALLNVGKCILTGNIACTEKRSRTPSLLCFKKRTNKENIYGNGRTVVIIHRDKKYPAELTKDIERLVVEKPDTALNPKTGIFHERQGIDFCGYRIWPSHVKPRKRTVKRAGRRLKKLAGLYQNDPKSPGHAKTCIMSFLGYVKHCSGLKTTRSILRSATFKTGKKPALPDNAPQGQK